MRFKKLSNGSKSIYLDIYVDGKRSYEYLKLYILPELNANIKGQNRTTMAAAEKIKSPAYNPAYRGQGFASPRF